MDLWGLDEREAVSYKNKKHEEKKRDEWLHKSVKGGFVCNESVIERKRKKQEGE